MFSFFDIIPDCIYIYVYRGNIVVRLLVYIHTTFKNFLLLFKLGNYNGNKNIHNSFAAIYSFVLVSKLRYCTAQKTQIISSPNGALYCIYCTSHHVFFHVCLYIYVLLYQLSRYKLL